MLGRTKLPFRNVQVADRTVQEIQSAMRQIAADSNQRLRCLLIDEYGDTTSWNTILTTVASATWTDTKQSLTLSKALKVGDVLHIVGRANTDIAAGCVADSRLIVYEGNNAYSTVKKETFWENGAGFQGYAFACKHTIKHAGTCRLAVQLSRLSGAGNVYLKSMGSIVCQVWRP